VILFLLFIVVLLIGLTAAAVMGKFGGFMADPTSSQSFGGLRHSGAPTEPLKADDIVALHFDQALRGYRMDQVDEVIGALTERLRELEAQLQEK
jgi:DivIVA domain-containing protein